MKKKEILRTGFTIVELLVVVVIIGILASVVAVNYTKSLEDVPSHVITADFRALDDAIKLFKLNTHQYPESIDDLIYDNYVKGWKGPYLDAPPLDPWKRPYIYEYTGDSPKPYIFTTLGADGIPGGKGENQDYCSLDKYEEYVCR